MMFGAVNSPVGAGENADFDAHIARADSTRAEKLYEIELASLMSARAVDSTRVEVLWRLNRTFVELGEIATEKKQKRRFYEEAMRYGEAAISMDSTLAVAYTWLAIAEGTTASVVGFKRKVELSWKVRDHAQKSIELDPDNDVPYHVLARWNFVVASIGGLKRTMANLFFGKLPDASYEESIKNYQRAIEINDLIHHRLELAKVYIKLKRVDEARATLEHALILEGEKRLDDRYKSEARKMLAQLD
jgi:tetratricopeptide (TPR) repeat protein